MNDVGKPQTAFCAYSRYLDLIDSRCSGADVQVATFSAWLGQEVVDCTSVCMRGVFNSGLDAVPVVGSEGLFQGVSNNGGDEEAAKKYADCGAGSCSEGDNRVNCARTTIALNADVVKGPNWARNRVWARERKARKIRKKGNLEKGEDIKKKNYDSSVNSREFGSDALAESVREKWCAQNALETERARRALIAMKSLPIEEQVRCNRVKMQASIERGMVSIEKTHARLAASGDVPNDSVGFATTVLGSESISPSSSASLQEFRACQKALLDAEARNERMANAMRAAGVVIPCGPRTQRSMDHNDGIWTDNTENRAEWDEKYSAYGQQTMSQYGLPGKVRIIPC